MKEFWIYYDYVRRWWRFFLLGICLGALAGFGFYLEAPKVEFNAVFIIEAINVDGLQFMSKQLRTEVEAAEWIDSAITELQAVKSGEATVHGVAVEKWTAALWKPIVLGSVIGGLLVVGFVYVWVDILEYSRHRRQIVSRDADVNDS